MEGERETGKEGTGEGRWKRERNERQGREIGKGRREEG